MSPLHLVQPPMTGAKTGVTLCGLADALPIISTDSARRLIDAGADPLNLCPACVAAWEAM